MLTVRDVARQLNVSIPCLYALVRGGMLPHYRIGSGRGAIRIRQDDVDTYLERCRIEPNERANAAPARRRLKHIRL